MPVKTGQRAAPSANVLAPFEYNDDDGLQSRSNFMGCERLQRTWKNPAGN